MIMDFVEKWPVCSKVQVYLTTCLSLPLVIYALVGSFVHDQPLQLNTVLYLKSSISWDMYCVPCSFYSAFSDFKEL